MGNMLDAILKFRMVEGPETADTSEVHYSKVIDMSGVEENFAVQYTYDSAVDLDASISVEVSVNSQDFIEIPETVQTITDIDGTHLWDFQALGSNYIRIKTTVRQGSLDIQSVDFSGKRRH